MAAMATRMVLDPAADEASRRVELATSLVIRSSTAAPAARAPR
jgi:DNA-binding LacI/PurR family transcriptional regulator